MSTGEQWKCAGCGKFVDRDATKCCDGKFYCVECYPAAFAGKESGQAWQFAKKPTGA